MLPCGDRVYAGHGFRTSLEALDHLDAATVDGRRTERLALVDPRFYHLDTCLFPVTEHLAAYFPDAFDEETRELLRAHFDDLIEVSEHDTLRFACNALHTDSTVVLNTGCAATVEALTRRVTAASRQQPTSSSRRAAA